MEAEKFDEIKSSLDRIETNTSWTWYVNNELEDVNKKLEVMIESIQENNELLRELITAINNR